MDTKIFVQCDYCRKDVEFNKAVENYGDNGKPYFVHMKCEMAEMRRLMGRST